MYVVSIILNYVDFAANFIYGNSNGLEDGDDEDDRYMRANVFDEDEVIYGCLVEYAVTPTSQVNFWKCPSSRFVVPLLVNYYIYNIYIIIYIYIIIIYIIIYYLLIIFQHLPYIDSILICFFIMLCTWTMIGSLLICVEILD